MYECSVCNKPKKRMHADIEQGNADLLQVPNTTYCANFDCPQFKDETIALSELKEYVENVLEKEFIGYSIT